MSLNWATYQSATGCTKYGPQGAQAILTYTEDVFAELHRSLGICNCRVARGGSSFSHHAECRAIDTGFIVIAERTFAYDYAVILGEHGKRTGIDHIITNRAPWESGRGEPILFSAKSPNGRVYTGAHPHKDHNHIGLTRNAGTNLTYATLIATYGRPEEVAARLLLQRPVELEENMPAFPLWYGDGYDQAPADSRFPGEDRSNKREDVRNLQDRLNKLGANLTLDGLYGPGTVAAAKKIGGGWTGHGEGKEGKWWGGNQNGELDWEISLAAARSVIESVGGTVDAYSKQEADSRFAEKHDHPYAPSDHPHTATVTLK